jgi:Tfp pilus assembly protein PilO
MRDLFSFFTQKERRILGILCLLMGLALIFYVFVAGGQKRSYTRSIDILASAERDLNSARSNTAQIAAEREMWEQAQKDMQALREEYFYSEMEWGKVLRLDLERILDESRIQHSRKKFDYAIFEKERVQKVLLDFSVTGRYDSLKKFIHAVENFPKFLMIERIDFLDIDPQGRGIKLRIQLAGYYALP